MPDIFISSQDKKDDQEDQDFHPHHPHENKNQEIPIHTMPDIFIAPQDKKDNQEHHDHIPKQDVTPHHSHKNENPAQESDPKIQAIPGIFSTLIYHPHKFTFKQQKEDEKIIIFMRRHFATNLPWIIAVVIAIIVPLILIPLFQLIGIPLFSVPLGLSITLTLFYYLLILGFALYNFVDWFYNVGVATEKRLLDLDFMQLSHINIALTQLTEVEDVIYKQKGFLASYFNYGDVIAHTVTGKEDFVFEKVPRPYDIVNIISQQIGDSGH